MDQQPRALTLDEVSQLFFQEGTPRNGALKSVGGLAALYVVHQSGKPFPQHAFVTTLGTRVEAGNADDFHTLMSHVEMGQSVAVQDDSLKNTFSSAFVPIMHIKKSCYTHGKELAAEIPAGQTMRWICEPIRVIEGCLMPEIDEAQGAEIIRWAQEHTLFGELKEDDLVPLDKFANLDGKTIYPQGWISIQEKMGRFKQAQQAQRNAEAAQRNAQAAENADLEELDL
jgi:hypothetical protein